MAPPLTTGALKLSYCTAYIRKRRGDSSSIVPVCVFKPVLSVCNCLYTILLMSTIYLRILNFNNYYMIIQLISVVCIR